MILENKRTLPSAEAASKLATVIAIQTTGPEVRRTKDLTIAFVIGAFAVCLETYQLGSQYVGC